MTPIQLSELSLAGLRDLDVKLGQAQRDWDTAANATLAALGLDPTLNHHLNLTTGVITPAAQE
jgi:hypothetical protein